MGAKCERSPDGKESEPFEEVGIPLKCFVGGRIYAILWDVNSSDGVRSRGGWIWEGLQRRCALFMVVLKKQHYEWIDR